MPAMTVAQITPEFITNMYLYGQGTVPANLANNSVLRPPNQLPVPVDVDTLDYMTNGPGRFASPTFFDVVRLFFEAGLGLAPRTYTEEELSRALGVRWRHIDMQMYDFDKNSADYGSRVYIWNSVAFEIDETVTRFVIQSDGTRYIENLRIIPYVNPGESEDFDFVSDNLLTQIGNDFLLHDEIDPSRIGRTVKFAFTGQVNTTAQYTSADYWNDKANLPPEDGNILDAREAIRALSDGLFAVGSTRFVEDGRAVSIGSHGSDVIRGFRTHAGVDLDEDRHLAPFAAVGVHYVTGAGNDQVQGTAGSDVLDGGQDRDTLRGGSGHDTYVYVSGDGQDTVTDSDGAGAIRLNGIDLSAATFTLHAYPKYQGKRAWRTEINGQEVFLIELDGNVQTSAVLRVEGAALGVGGWIDITDFSSGELGLTLDTTNAVAELNAGPNLREGQATALSGQLMTAAVSEGHIRISVDPSIAGTLRIVTGAQTLSFSANGTLDIPLEAGHNSFAYALLSQGDVDTNTQINVTATLLDQELNPSGPSVTASIAFDATTEPSFGPTTPAAFVSDDENGNSITDWNDGVDSQAYANPFLIQGNGGNDDINYYLRWWDDSTDMHAALTAEGGTGRDYINLTAEHVWLNGGDDNDHLVTRGAESVAIGGAGSDVILAATWSWEGNDTQGDRIFGADMVDLATAIALGESQSGSTVTGDLLSSLEEQSDDFIVGSNARDVLAGGGGSDTMVGGAGDDLILGDRWIQIVYTHTIGNVLYPTFEWDWSAQTTTDPSGAMTFTHQLTNTVTYRNGDTSTNNFVELSYAGAADSIHAGAGNDRVLAGDGDDFVDGGTGNDVLLGESGADTLLGGAGNDVLDGDDAGDVGGSDFLDGGDGDDVIAGSLGSDVLYGGTGQDILLGDDGDEGAGEDYLNGEDGDDDLHGGARSDVLIGGEGDDELFGDDQHTNAEEMGDDYLDGGSGHDQLVGAGGADFLTGGAGNDTLIGHAPDSTPDDERSDYLDGGAGDDLLWGWGGGDQLIGGDGADQLIGDDISLEAELHGDDHLDGGAGDDVMWGLGGDDLLIGGDGNDVLDGDDVSTPELEGDDVLDGGAGNDTLYGSSGADELIGGEGDDGLSGGTGADRLSGDSGNDSLHGGDGDDVLIGGIGADSLQGGGGNDTYVFSREDLYRDGDIADGIIDIQGNNRVVFTSLTSDEVQLVAGAQPGSINFFVPDTTIGLVVRNAINGSVASFQFSDGTVWTAAQLIGSRYESQVTSSVTESNATLIGGRDADTLTATGGGARMSGGEGDDVLTGGLGTTTYDFDHGHGIDTIVDLSDQVASGGQHRNVVVFGADIVPMDLNLVFDASASELRVMVGSADGMMLSNFTSTDVLHGARTLDEFRFEDGTTATWQQVVALRGIEVTNSGGVASFSGTNVADRIRGGSVNETINAGAGDDTIDGGGGNDMLMGGAGSDTYLFGRSSGGDTIDNDDTQVGKIDCLQIAADIASGDIDFFKIGTSLLVRLRNTTNQVMVNDFFTNAGLDEIRFGDGTTYTAATVPWQNPPGNWISYQRGDGVRTHAINDPADSILDALHFGANVDPASVQLGSDANGNLVIRFRNADGTLSNDRITFTGGVTNPAAALNQITFDAAPNILWDTAEQLIRARIPTDGNDYVYGSQGSDFLAGLAGNDVVRAGAGNDIVDGGLGTDDLYGGDGNDTLAHGERMFGEAGDDVLIVGSQPTYSLQGGAGSDTYLVERDATSVAIDSIDSAAGSIDVLRFGTGILPGNVRLRRVGNSLDVHVIDPTRPASQQTVSAITVWSYFAANGIDKVIDEIRFDDTPGTVWRYADVLPLLFIGDETGESINGAATNDVIRGNGGDDTLNGFDGNDDLDGGSGNDALIGGNGNDVYRFARGAGSDRISDSSGIDRIELAAGILPEHVTLYRLSQLASGDSLLLVLDDANEQLTIDGYFTSGDGSRIEQISFADGSSWDVAAIAAHTTDLSGTVDTQNGTAADDTFIVDHGADVVVEADSAGLDTIESSVSYVLPTYVENLTLLGQFNLSGTGNELANIIVGNAGDNYINGYLGVDTLIGGAGDDIYVAETLLTANFGSNFNNIQDVIVEVADGGMDTLLADAYSAILPANVERLILRTFVGPFNFPGNGDLTRRFTGNALDNYIDISAMPAFYGARVYIDGGAGADIMIGNALGNTYVVDNVGDRIFDVEGHEGPDEVISSINYVLEEGIENLTLIGIDAISGTGTSEANVLLGNEAANTLTGGAGDDKLNGAGGTDTLIGGVGDDFYTVDPLMDVVVENANEGRDQVTLAGAAAGSYGVAAFSNVEVIALADSMGGSNLLGDSADNELRGNRHANTLQGGEGNDVIFDGTGSNDADSLFGGGGNDRLTSYGGFDVLDGGLGDDNLVQWASSNIINHATFVFGNNYGNDTIAITSTPYASAKISLAAGVSPDSVSLTRDGHDLVLQIAGDSGSLRVQSFFTSVPFETTPGTVSEIRFVDGTVWNLAMIVNRVRAAEGTGPTTGDDAFFGTTGADTIDALAGNDVVFASAGDDSVTGNDGADELWGESGNDTLIGAAGSDILIGGVGADNLIGGSENDTLRGGSGADSYQFSSGSGSDIVHDSIGAVEDAAIDEIVFDASVSAGDMVLRLDPNAPFERNLLISNSLTGDQIVVWHFFRSEFGYSDADHIERIRFADGTTWDLAEIRARATEIYGTGGDDVLWAAEGLPSKLFGLDGADTLEGSYANDLLDGGSGNDLMRGAYGDDTYVVDAAGDVIEEYSGEGTDTVQASVTWTLGSNLENLVLEGAGNINGTGNSLLNHITGNSANNTLNGGGGADILIGGTGDDTYLVDNSADAIVEASAEGTDLVQSSVTYTLADNVENLTLTNSSGISGTGNALDNVLTGNNGNNTLTGGAGNDTLNGGSGSDTMLGGIGDDVYVVAQTGDVVTENAGEGIDRVQSAIAHTLAANVENLTLTGTAAINGTGNALDNALIGNSGSNTLTGNAGNDILDGGSAGTDALRGGQGNDTYILTRSSGVTITENASEGTDTVLSSVSHTLGANVENLTLTGATAISGTGNTLANVIIGNASNNTLTGGAGNDTLTGGDGADIYSYSSGHGSDTINNVSTDTAQDRLNVTNLTRSQVTFSQSTNDLIIARNGTPSDSIRITDWFAASGNQLDHVQFTDQTLTAAQINAMFGGGGIMAVAGSGEMTSHGNDTLNSAAIQFIDAMNHFGGKGRDQIVLGREVNGCQSHVGEELAVDAYDVARELAGERKLGNSGSRTLA